MHYAAAEDRRAGKWALNAAREAIDMEAHAEAYAQLERALAGELEPRDRLLAFELAATEASALFPSRSPSRLPDVVWTWPAMTMGPRCAWQRLSP